MKVFKSKVILVLLKRVTFLCLHSLDVNCLCGPLKHPYMFNKVKLLDNEGFRAERPEFDPGNEQDFCRLLSVHISSGALLASHPADTDGE
jgi:hypothetical protein